MSKKKLENETYQQELYKLQVELCKLPGMGEANGPESYYYIRRA